ncbi:hypothetical protein FACS1894198_4650 [Clostridia bacterium]|nr:hypothetical protein FACS1894198_4650 [Clostridia bacterium]
MQTEIEKILAGIPEIEPDDFDLAMLANAKKEKDKSVIELNKFIASLEGYNGKISIRMPRSLHKKIMEKSKAEGVSLNQYVVYKLGEIC